MLQASGAMLVDICLLKNDQFSDQSILPPEEFSHDLHALVSPPGVSCRTFSLCFQPSTEAEQAGCPVRCSGCDAVRRREHRVCPDHLLHRGTNHPGQRQLSGSVSAWRMTLQITHASNSFLFSEREAK